MRASNELVPLTLRGAKHKVPTRAIVACLIGPRPYLEVIGDFASTITALSLSISRALVPFQAGSHTSVPIYGNQQIQQIHMILLSLLLTPKPYPSRFPTVTLVASGD